MAVILVAGAGAALAQSANPRIGRWKLRQDAPPPASNIMTYEALPGGGMKVTVDSVNREGRKGGWKKGKATQFLLNVLSEDGKMLTVTFRNPNGRITSVATYERMP